MEPPIHTNNHGSGKRGRCGIAALLLVASIWLTAVGAAKAPDSPVVVTVDDSPAARMQVIDGFGTCIGAWGGQHWFQSLYYDDMGCSIMRMDLTPHFVSPYSDLHYDSPWFMGSATRSAFNLEDKANPGGPEANRVRTYTGPQDYARLFGGRRAPIAVMGPEIDRNIRLFDYRPVEPQGRMAQAGQSRAAQLGDFKLYGSIWSPAPWLKVSSGRTYNGDDRFPYPPKGTPWPFIWGGNFAGGRLDTSDTPLDVFNDGTGPTSALTQFARCTAAYIRGFQVRYGVRFYAISIQNEVNFEEFYNSATYPLSSQYIAALKAVRRELDRYPDLKAIQIIGPEDLLGGDAWGMWQLGGGANTTHKNLHYLADIAADTQAEHALAFFCIHGYASDGATSAGADSQQWDWWRNGWNAAPARGLPSQVKGFAAYGKRSWMTETSGEQPQWLAPQTGFPGNGAWSIAFKTQQALTAGRQSAILYWQFAEKDDQTTPSCLTRKSNPAAEAKYAAFKHFARFIRPGAVALRTSFAGDASAVTASAYVHDRDGTITVVLVNRADQSRLVQVRLPADWRRTPSVNGVTSSAQQLWQPIELPLRDGQVSLELPAYSVATLHVQLH